MMMMTTANDNDDYDDEQRWGEEAEGGERGSFRFI